MESGGHGPKAMSTEYHTRFIKQQFRNGGGLYYWCVRVCIVHDIVCARVHEKNALIWSSRMKQARGPAKMSIEIGLLASELLDKPFHCHLDGEEFTHNNTICPLTSGLFEII